MKSIRGDPTAACDPEETFAVCVTASLTKPIADITRAIAPPTVFRTLKLLLEQGLVHRLSSLNAFVGCSRPRHAGSGQFLICRA
jgi:Fe2+ or Zn2+ uptake regulation protein